MQYTEIIFVVKMKIFTGKELIFLIFLLKTYIVGTHSNEYPQCMLWIKNKKISYIPAYPSFAIQKWGLRGYSLHGHVFLMVAFNVEMKEGMKEGKREGMKEKGKENDR